MKNFKKTLAIFLAALMMVSAFAAYSVFATMTDGENTPAPAAEPALASEPAPVAETGNTGTATAGWAEETRNGVTAYYVDDLDDFKAFHDNASTNSYYEGKTVKLTADLDMAQANWSWTRVAAFNGTFDGQNHTISNMATAEGIFKNTTAGTAAKRNEVKIMNVSFVGGGVVPTTLAGNTAFFIFQPGNYSDVEFYNVHADVTVRGTNSTAVFISRLNTTNTSVVIRECTNSSEVSNTYRAAGYVATVEATSTLTIVDSTFTGKVTTTHRTSGSEKKDYSENGGFVAYSTSTGYGEKVAVTLDGCSFNGTLKGTGNAIGGFVGCLVKGTVTISDCASAGTFDAAGVNEVSSFVGFTYNSGSNVGTVNMLSGNTFSNVSGEQWYVKDNGETVAVRFVGTVNDNATELAKYDNVGMKMTITLKGDTDTVLIDGKKYYSASVYEAITFEGRYVKAEDGEYLFAVNMGGFKKDASYEVTFVSFATYDGVEIYDLEGATTISVVNGAIVKA